VQLQSYIFSYSYLLKFLGSKGCLQTLPVLTCSRCFHVLHASLVQQNALLCPSLSLSTPLALYVESYKAGFHIILIFYGQRNLRTACNSICYFKSPSSTQLGHWWAPPFRMKKAASTMLSVSCVR
jgi:hypothetical protein